MKQFLRNLWEVLQVVLIAGVTVFIIRTFIVQPFLVSGTSMEPNFASGNYLLVDEVTYRFEDPQRGDVIVFRYPGDQKTFYIKRIIGLPGEHVMIVNGQIIVDGMTLNEYYLSKDLKTIGTVDRELREDEYFVLGDNRYYSFDSRQWGILPKKNIVGIVRLRLFPLSKIGLFGTVVYDN